MDWAAIYEDDIEGWAEAQVAALRRLAATPGPWSNVVDFENVIEEVEDLGSERRRSVESLLELVFVHLIKLRAEPEAVAVEHWRDEVHTFLNLARSKGARSMRVRLELNEIWRDSIRRADRQLRRHNRTLPVGLPEHCPFTFEQMLVDRGFDPLTDALFASPQRADR